MDELLAKLTDAARISEEAAKKAVGIIFGFIDREAPQLQFGALLSAIPGAKDLEDAAAATGGAAEGLMGKIGGLLGGASGDVMTAIDRLTNEAGLQAGQIEIVGKQIFAFLRSKLGDDAISKIVVAIPGLNRFV